MGDVAGLRIGQFALEARLGSGGMGEVWKARHAPTGRPAAVKLLRAEVGDSDWYLASFRNEVRAVAQLDHPHIVRIYDQGQLDRALGDPDSTSVSVGRGSPWLAMELVDGTPLSRLRGRLRWTEVRPVLLGLLAALGHAHARDLVHRDLKPGNAMLARDGRVVLLDFGLAHVMDQVLDPSEMGEVVGTTAYMAPEQFDGDELDYGPWTDLYALGCVTWSLITGDPPFGLHSTAQAHREAHQRTPLPELRPLRPMPQPLEGWLRRLLAKDPGDRFQRAADAAQALLTLGQDVHLTDTPADRTFDLDAQDATAVERLSVSTVLCTGLFEDASASGALAPRPTSAQAAPGQGLPLPGDWRILDAPGPQTARLPGTGLGLFGVRRVPVVGRERERDALWAALRRPEDTPAVVIQGAAGTGKTALADWLCDLAAERGAAQVLTVRHDRAGRGDAPGQGLQGALARAMRVAGLPADTWDQKAALRSHLGRVLRRWGIDTGTWLDPVAAVVRPGAEDPDAQATPAAGARHAVARQLLTGLARQRLLILRLEDVQWGADSLAFALHLLAHPLDVGPGRVLVLVTARELDPEQRESLLLDRLLAQRGAVRLPIGPLAPGWRARLIRDELGLTGELAVQVERRTGGHPLFAVQLVEDWVGRGVLVPAQSGFALAPGQSPDLPADLHTLWQQRVARAVDGCTPLERQALELAAVLGVDVDHDEWVDACRILGAWSSAGLVERLLTHGLAELDPRGHDGGFRFVHGMLQESLVRSAEDQGHVGMLHGACADMLQRRVQAARPGTRPEDLDVVRLDLRLGRHLLARGDAAGAIGPLSRGAWQCVRDSEYLLAEDALADRTRALDALGVPTHDRRRTHGRVMAARVARRRNQPARAAALAAQAEAEAAAGDWPDLWAQALREQARAAWADGRRGRAIDAILAALVQARRGDDALATAWCRRDLGLLLVEVGDGRETSAATVLTDARAVFQAHAEVFGAADCMLARAVAAAWTSGHLPARDLDAAVQGFTESLHRQEPAHALVGLARCAQLRGDRDAAEAHAAAAAARFVEIGAPEPLDAVLQRCRVLLAGADPASRAHAQALLDPRVRDAGRTLLADDGSRVDTLAEPTVVAAIAAAWRRDAPETRRLLDLADMALADTGERTALFAEDAAVLAGLCEDLDAGLALRARDLHIETWTTLGRSDRVGATPVWWGGQAGGRVG